MILIDMLKRHFVTNKKRLIVIVLLLCGILMIAFSSTSFSASEDGDTSESLAEYKQRLEKELSDLCSSVKGVGKCRVSVSFERGAEHTYKGSMLIESKPPKVLGITVVCKGADSDAVKAEISGMLTALFDIGANRIAVLKLNS